MTLNLIITDTDLKNLRRLEDQERKHQLTSDNIFRGMIYTMLSTQEAYTRQMDMYNKLLNEHLDTATAILERPDDVAKIAKGLRKSEYLIKLAKWWSTSNIYDEIIKDVSDNRTQEFSIRNKIAKDTDAAGLSYKGASLVMNMIDYRQVVPLDVWTLRALVADDYPIKPYYYIPKNGKKNFKHTYLGKGIYFDRGVTAQKEYDRYEGFFWDLTEKHNERSGYKFSSFDFRRLLWLKRSAWGKEFGNDLDQLTFPFEC